MNLRERFDKFTERARKVLNLAEEEAQRFQHSYIGTEHLILGLMREPEDIAVKVLRNLGVEPDQVRSAVEFIIGRGDRIVLGEAGLTPRAKKVIELAIDEARSLNHDYIGTEHLLLGLVREGEGIAAGVLESLGVNWKKARTQTIQVLSSSSAAAEPPTTHVLPSVPQEAITLVPPIHDSLITQDDLPPVPPEAATLVAESDPALRCNTCQARCPSYFTYCFHCGSKLKPE
jgi:ATP-dependent Clp protease ATP-binding subunit ClpC